MDTEKLANMQRGAELIGVALNLEPEEVLQSLLDSETITDAEFAEIADSMA